jgi:hypothetical protein
MLKTAEGIYQNGQIQLTSSPEGLRDPSQVLVMFLDAGQVDAAKMKQWLDHLETLAGIQQGLEELHAGQARPVEEFIQEMQQAYGISG